MKEKLRQISILGGFYLIISFFLNLFENSLLDFVNSILFFALVVWAIVLLFIKPLVFLDKFRMRFPKSAIYLTATGYTIYLAIPVLIYGAVSGYKQAMAKYNNIEYDYIAFERIMELFGIINLLLIVISLIVATVIVIIKIIKDKKV